MYSYAVFRSLWFLDLVMLSGGGRFTFYLPDQFNTENGQGQEKGGWEWGVEYAGSLPAHP